MNDPQDPYDPYAAQQQLIGYDPYGRPLYGQVPAQQPLQPAPQPPYGQQYEPPYEPSYEQSHAQQSHAQQYGYEQQPQGYAPQAPSYGYDTRQQPSQWIPQQAAAQAPAQPPAAAPAPVPGPRRSYPEDPAGPDPAGQEPGPGGPAAGYRTEQFAFIDQPDEDSEDVIDWLAFTESRTERREEARRRGRNRVVALVVVLALLLVGGLGYLWYAGKLPFLDAPGPKKGAPTAAGAQKRDMIVVHLRNTKRGGSSTALLVDNVTARQGATVLLPNALAVTKDDGTGTTLGKSVEDGGIGTREALDTALGTRIGGTWRLDTPFLERMVELVGGIETDTDTAVPADDQAKTPAVGQGPRQTLTGAMAVAYATYRAPGEPEAKQLERTGRVLYAVLRKIPSDPKAAATTVESLGQILDPGLDAQNLGGLLARIGEHAKTAAYRTEVLSVKPDGGLTDDASKKVVKELLGGTVTAAQPGAAPRVGLKDATGDEKAQVAAKAALLNGGYALVDGGRADRPAATSQVTYQDEGQRARAVEVAKTLGLPETAVKKAESVVNADVVVTLGKDWKPS
ncbi:LytR family transcriptional attenuator [Streptomyces sp. 3211.6]|uniref:LCP family protein n=1 Tax=Streptomyces sp. 3211.6 TaxID=1938845 RepID=UPI000EAF3556|nr:LCP family protein [Streptomyces sp. 3211.6]RKT04670.1 LytR family transcriptional attenuator [Streptomyces sp. 3211.6]